MFAPDGLLGLGFQSVSKYNATPFFINLISQGIVSNPVFGVRLANEGSELFLGGTNRELYQGDFTYVPVTKEVRYTALYATFRASLPCPGLLASHPRWDYAQWLQSLLSDPGYHRHWFNTHPRSRRSSCGNI